MKPTGLYDYTTPPGFGDTFFQYAFNADSLTDGVNAMQQGIPISDGAFVARAWSGLPSVVALVSASPAGAIQIYDNNKRAISDLPLQISNFHTTKAILPELYYDVNSNIRFDLINVLRAVAGTDGGLTVFQSQLVFTGVRRRANWYSDPQPANYKWYPKPFEIPYSLVINQYASTSGVLNSPNQFTIPIQDYDFELWRVELQLQSDQQASQFKIQLYDNDWNAMSNVPLLANRFFHLDPKHSSGELNWWPSPPVLYKVNSVIRFDIFSLLFAPTVLPQTFNLNFVGVRRIPCS